MDGRGQPRVSAGLRIRGHFLDAVGGVGSDRGVGGVASAAARGRGELGGLSLVLEAERIGQPLGREPKLRAKAIAEVVEGVVQLFVECHA